MFVAAWALLAGSAIGLFRRKQTSMITFRPAGTLVTSGPYAFTRNPMYVSLALLTIGFALFLNTWWVVLLLVPALLIVQQFVIAQEERYLRRRFGADYEAYTTPSASLAVIKRTPSPWGTDAPRHCPDARPRLQDLPETRTPGVPLVMPSRLK